MSNDMLCSDYKIMEVGDHSDDSAFQEISDFKDMEIKWRLNFHIKYGGEDFWK